MDFNDLPWHDACLTNIFIDRKQPGEMDTVTLSIEWPQDEWTLLHEIDNPLRKSCTITENGYFSTFEFFDCYALNLQMNFGIIALESILYAECLTDSDELKKVQNEWLKMKMQINDLKHYRINTNSTNSTIDIICKDYKLTPSIL